MSHIHAYYLPASSTSRPVGVEHLDALGWKIRFVDGNTPDEIEEAARKHAQEVGYPVTEEGCIVRFNPKREEEMNPNVIIVNSLPGAF